MNNLLQTKAVVTFRNIFGVDFLSNAFLLEAYVEQTQNYYDYVQS